MSHPESDGLGWLSGEDEAPKPAKPKTGKIPAKGGGSSQASRSVAPKRAEPETPPGGAAPSDDVLAWLSGETSGGDTIASPVAKSQSKGEGGVVRRKVESLEELSWLEQERADSAAQGEDTSETPAVIHEDEDGVGGDMAASPAGESMFAAALDDFFSNIEDEGSQTSVEEEANTTLSGRRRAKSQSEGKVDKVVSTLIRYLTRKDPIKDTQIDSIFKMTVGKLVDAMNAELLAIYYPIDEKGKLHIQGVYWAKGLWRDNKDAETRHKRQIENLTNLLLDPKADIVGRSIDKRISVTSLDAKKDPDFKNTIGAAAGIDVGPMLTVPILQDQSAFGAIQVMNKAPHCGEEFFSYQDQKLLEEVAFYCGKIIQRVKDPKHTTTEAEMARYVARLAKTEVLDLTSKEVEWDDRLWEIVGHEAILKYAILPRKALSSKALSVVMINPLDDGRRRDFEAKTEKTIEEAFVATKTQIQAVLDKKFKKEKGIDTSDLANLALEATEGGPEKVDLKSEDEKEDAAPIIKLANRIIEDAYARGASDIHIEPYETETRVRYRVDGNLEERMRLPRKASGPLVARLKIMSNLDIAEKRLPQDGRIKFKQFSRTGLDIDLRVATGPMVWGEKCVMRLLVRNSISLGLDAMGFSPKNLELFRWASKQAYGMILNVGPTGSGKTTTLYSALTEVNTIDVNIQTAEDPVEYPLTGINQMQMHKDIGLTFASALRCYLRMDPDIILVGEIRDLETAEIGIEAALTGHLLFSTLHTNDAAGTVTRFIEMGVEPFMVSSCLLLVCAQRLARRLCKNCKTSIPANEDTSKILMQDERPIRELFTTKEGGCEKCGNSGYKGRVGIHEILTLNDELRGLINKSVSSDVLKEASIRNGMKTLWKDGLWKVKEGITDLKEIMANVRADEDMKSG